MIHELKVQPPFFERLIDGTKTFEVRRDDRGFQRGDVLRLNEWIPERGGFTDGNGWPIGEYTGRTAVRRVGFIFRQGFGCDLGPYVVLSLLPVDAE